MPDSALPPHLRGKLHWDWPTFFTIRWRWKGVEKKFKVGLQWVPRGWTSFKWRGPEIVFGKLPASDYRHFVFKDQKPEFEGRKTLRDDVWSPKPITSPGTWQFSVFTEAPLWAWSPSAVLIILAFFVPWWAKILCVLLQPWAGPWYIAVSGKRKDDGMFRHWRAGTRWDDVDDYATILVIATRRFTGGDEQDTST